MKSMKTAVAAIALVASMFLFESKTEAQSNDISTITTLVDVIPYAQTNETAGFTVPLVTTPPTVVADVVLDTVLNIPNETKIKVVAWIVDYIKTRGALVTGYGANFDGNYGAFIGQDLALWSSRSNGFSIVAHHASFYGNKSLDDLLGAGFKFKVNPPKWLSGFALITTRPSKIGMGIRACYPTTQIFAAEGKLEDITILGSVDWSF